MNSIQKRSLLISSILSFEIIAITFLSDYFNYLFILMLVTIISVFYYIFDLKFTLPSLKEKSKFLILPVLFNLSYVLMISSVYLTFFRVVYFVIFFIVNYYLFVALKRVENLEERAAIFQRNVLVTIGFLTILLSLSAAFKTYVLLSISKVQFFPAWLLIIVVSIIVYLVSYFLSWENGLDMNKMFPYNLVFSLLASEITLISVIWIVNYPVFSKAEKATLGGFPLPAVFLTIIYYFIWGIISHKMDRSLTRKVMTEYILFTLIFLVILLFTTKWQPII